MQQNLLHELDVEAFQNYVKRKDILDPLFPHQTNFIKSKSRRKSLWCTRRSAKSYTAGLYLHQTALDYPGSNCLYLGLTRESAHRIIWKDILFAISKKHDFKVHANNSKLTITHTNGSVIHISGVDSIEADMQKLLGPKWKLIIIDECQSYSIDMRTLVYGILGPATVDQGGTICIMGTSGNLTSGLFYDVTTGKEAGWELFQWTAYDNPYVSQQWENEIEDIRVNRPLFMQTSLYKQWFLNQWVIDESAKVYKFSKDRNVIGSVGQYDLQSYHFILGIDLAHSPDSTAFVVGCYTEGNPVLYIVYAFKALGMDITDVGLHIHLLEKKYKFDVKICDGANKQAIAELNNRHKLNLISADKTGKIDFITIQNDDFVQKRIMLLESETQSLQEEYEKLIWLCDSNGKVIIPKKEDPMVHNDLSDACLYLWRYCYTYLDLFVGNKKWINPHDQSQWEPAHIEKLQEQIRKEQNPNHLDLEWDKYWEEEKEYE